MDKKEKVYELIKRGSILKINGKNLEINIDSDDDKSENMLVTLIARVLGNMYNNEIYRHPKTWRDAFKEQVLPFWARKYLKINYKEVEIRKYNVCPHIDWQKDNEDWDRHIYFLDNGKERKDGIYYLCQSNSK